MEDSRGTAIQQGCTLFIPSSSHCFTYLGPSVITQYSNTLSQSFEDVCCNVCISKCQESRSHSTLTWVFFHLPKLLQPQLKNPEKLHTGDTRPVFHTSINSLLNHRIALNWFLFLNVTSGMNWKMYFCFSYEWTVMRYLKMSSL